MTMGGRSTAGRGGRIVEPARELLEVGDADRQWRVADPPGPGLVEVHDDDADVVYLLEPVPAYEGGREIDTTGTQPGYVLTAGPDGVYRPAAQRLHWPASDDIRVGQGAPTDAAPLGAVHIDVAGGRVYRNGGSA